MVHFDELRRTIKRLSRDASAGDRSPELLAAMEDALSDGYISALMAEADIHKLRGDLAHMRAQLLRLRGAQSA